MATFNPVTREFEGPGTRGYSAVAAAPSFSPSPFAPLTGLQSDITALRSSPYAGIQPLETAGLETLGRLADTSGLLAAAKNQFETTSSPEIMARLTASGFGRSGAVGESLAKGFAGLQLPITQMGYQGLQTLGQAQLGVGQQIAARGQGNLQAIIQAQAVLEQLGFSREQAAQNAAQFAQELALRTREEDRMALAQSYQNALAQRQLSGGGGSAGGGSLGGSPFDKRPATAGKPEIPLIRGNPPPVTPNLANAPGFDTGASIFGYDPRGWNPGGAPPPSDFLNYTPPGGLARSPDWATSPFETPTWRIPEDYGQE